MAFIGSSVSSASVRRGHGVLTVCSLRRDVVVTPANSSSSMSRRDLLTLIGLGGVLSMGALVDSANAEEVAAPAAPATGATAPTKISGNYPTDAKNVLDNMVAACSFKKGTPGMSDAVSSIRVEMNDFVARYRRNDKVNGSASFNTLYTAINTLSGHYASYGNNYPVPEKRKKRLQQQFAEIDKALQRGR